MKLKVDGADVGSHVNRASVEGLGLGTMAPEAADSALSEKIRRTQIAENRSAESRHDRIARAAYYRPLDCIASGCRLGRTDEEIGR